jgi:putative transposase
MSPCTAGSSACPAVLADAAGRAGMKFRYWFIHETYVKVSGTWDIAVGRWTRKATFIDVFVSKKRYTKAATRFFTNVIDVHGAPTEVTTDRAPALARALTELVPLALRDTV